jgi:CRISPR system Cascade subunit CasD
MSTLLMRLAGPMQSWGTTSRFDERDTQLEPSKSGVLGLVCAALGRDRHESVDDLAALRMGVRVEREGVLMRDYQTATGVVSAAGKVDLERTVVSPRFFLSDAVFLVGLEGSRAVLEKIHLALQAPVWPLALGRKSFVPSLPVYLPDGLVEQALEDALQSWPCLVVLPAKAPQTARLMLEDAREGVIRLDQPMASFSERRFGPRFVKTLAVNFPAGGLHVPDTTAA